MGYYIEQGGALTLSGMGDLGRRKMSRKQRQLATFAAGAFAYGAATKWVAPGVKNLLASWKAKRKAARTRQEMEEANRIRKLLMKSSPEVFVQQPGMPPPAQIQRAVEASAAGQPVRVITKTPVTIPTPRQAFPATPEIRRRGLRLPPAPVAVKEKSVAEKYLPWAGAGLVALKIIGVV